LAWKRAVKWLLGFCLAAVALLAAAAVSCPLWLRPIAERQASAYLARPVAIQGLHLRPGNPVVLTVEDAVVGNPPDFPHGKEPFAHITRATVRLDILASLRHRQIVITSTELERPMVRAVATEDGRKNYSFDGLSALTGDAAGPGAGALRIVDGRGHVSLAGLRADLEVTFRTVETEEKGSEPRVVAKAEGTYAGQPVAANFTGSASLGSHDRPWQFELQVENGPTRASAKGTLQEPLSLRGASVDLLVAGPDMALLNPLTGVGFPATPPYELRGKLNYRTGLYRVSDVTGRVGRSDLEGTMTVAMRPGVRPEINADLHSRDVELRDIASLLGGDPGAPDTPGQTPQQTAQAVRIQAEARASPRLLPQGPLNLSNLKRTDLHLAYRAERIQGRSVPLDDLAFRMDVIDGACRAPPAKLRRGRRADFRRSLVNAPRRWCRASADRDPIRAAGRFAPDAGHSLPRSRCTKRDRAGRGDWALDSGHLRQSRRRRITLDGRRRSQQTPR
jgi:AsmA family protein